MIGFALRWEGQQHGVLWISGDTVLYDGVREVADRLQVDTAILHLGGVRFPVTGPAALHDDRRATRSSSAVSSGRTPRSRSTTRAGSTSGRAATAIEREFAGAPEDIRAQRPLAADRRGGRGGGLRDGKQRKSFAKRAFHALMIWTFAAEDPATPGHAREAVRAFAADQGADSDTLAAIELCVSEAVNNAVLHAYREAGRRGPVEVEVRRPNGYLCLYVRDHGCGLRRREDSPGLGLGLPLIAESAWRSTCGRRATAGPRSGCASTSAAGVRGAAV